MSENYKNALFAGETNPQLIRRQMFAIDFTFPPGAAEYI